jgi:5-amino-6-(5-phosphoribosylamino)uracil reductase
VTGERPYVLLSSAMSLDGYIDDDGPRRLLLSNEQDLDRVDGVRAGVDAILVGANTIRRDDPRLLVRSEDRRRSRTAAGEPADPVKVTVTASGAMDPRSAFFATGDGEKLVYAATATLTSVHRNLGPVATVVDAGDPLDIHGVLADLARRGVHRLMVEGGCAVNTLFLSEGVVDELHLACAPLFVGQADAPRFVHPAGYPQDADHRLTLAGTEALGDVVVLRYTVPVPG